MAFILKNSGNMMNNEFEDSLNSYPIELINSKLNTKSK